MNKKYLALTLVFVFTAAAAASLPEDGHEGNQTKCPVMGSDINKEVFVDYKGHRIFFCCAGCIEKFEEQPESYISKMKESGVRPMKLRAQSVCPVSGEELAGKDVYVDYDGARVYLCCPSCKAAFNADPAKYLKVISGRGETPEILENRSSEKTTEAS